MSTRLPPNTGDSHPLGDFAPFVSAFRSFRRVLELNNRVLEKIAEMERVLGGGYLFDQAFLRSTAASLGEWVRGVILSLNALTDNRYVGLFDRFEAIRGSLEDLVAGGPGPYGTALTLPYSEVNRDLDHLVGAKNANVGEVRNALGLRTPEGFAITAAAYRLFMEENRLFDRLRDLFGEAQEGDPEALWPEVEALFLEAEIPSILEAAVRDELLRLSRASGKPMLAVRSSAIGEDGARSFAGQFSTLLDVPPEDLFQAYRKILAIRFSPPLLRYAGEGLDVADMPVAVAVQHMVQVEASGVLYTQDSTGRNPEALTISAVAGSGQGLVGGKADADRYLLIRRPPFSLLESTVTVKGLEASLPGGERPVEVAVGGLRRGSSILTRRRMQALAEVGLLLEKAFGRPQDVEWALDGEDGPVILQSRPLTMGAAPAPRAREATASLASYPVVMEGRGHVAQLGIATGRVVHVNPDGDPGRFPVGGVAVCRFATPKLSGFVRRASAVITEVGSPTGHLATICREFRTPAVVGAEGALSLLAEGMEVTVDAEERTVYGGVISGLVNQWKAEDEAYLDTPEVRVLRRLLRWVSPVHLVDPADRNFRPDNCRTYHDILRFAHEKAIEALIHLHSVRTPWGAVPSRNLELDLPIPVRVIDLGGGIAPAGEDETIRLDDVRSRPFLAICDGLLKGGVWSREPTPLGFRDILSGFTRSASALATVPDYVGQNLAIVAGEYCNLSLRLGYHFNVIDAYMSANPDDNYVYFRFVGGFADADRRRRRVELIGMILESLYFKVERHGDLLVAKLKGLDAETMTSICARLGQLIAFTRQLDIRMADEEAVERYFEAFLDQVRTPIPEGR